MNYEDPANLYQSRSKIIWFIGVSIVLHLIALGILLYLPNHEGSNQGHGTTLLLEPVATNRPAPTESDSTKTASTESKSHHSNKVPGQRPVEPSNDTIKPDSQYHDSSANQVAGAPQNQGALENQNTQALTPSQKYQLKVTQHLLQKIGQAKQLEGEATIQMTIQPYGIATSVLVSSNTNSKPFEQWLTQAVLNANPMPTFSSSELGSKVELSIPIKLEREK